MITTPWYPAWAWRRPARWTALHSHLPEGPPHSSSAYICRITINGRWTYCTNTFPVM